MLAMACPARAGETVVEPKPAFNSGNATGCDRMFSIRIVTTCCSVPGAQLSSPTLKLIFVSGLKGFGEFRPTFPFAPCPRDGDVDCPAAYFGDIAQRASTSTSAAQR